MVMRVKEFRQYMANKVEAARKAIYDLAKPITGAAVDGYLKEFSGVPTKVSLRVQISNRQVLNLAR